VLQPSRTLLLSLHPLYIDLEPHLLMDHLSQHHLIQTMVDL